MKSTYLDSVWFSLILDAYAVRSFGMAGLENSVETMIDESTNVAVIPEGVEANSSAWWNDWCRVNYPILL